MDMDTVAAGRTGPFWDAIAGRVPGPPAAETLGWAIEEIDPAAGTIRVSFDARPAFRNPMGNIQGGFLAAMLDSATGIGALAALWTIFALRDAPSDLAPPVEPSLLPAEITTD